MLKDITLGQYFPGHSILHKLDPRVKLILVMLYISTLFLAKSFISYGIMFLFLITAIIVSQISIHTILKGMKPMIFIVIFTAVLNVFYTPGEPLFSWYFLTVTKEGLITAFFMTIRILMLVTGTFVLLTYTTSPIALTDALERLMKPLNKIKVPVHDLAMMMSLALRFIPTLIEETDKIINAQKARGADFESGNILHRAKALVPVLIPLFISAFRRAEDLAVAMVCRCYNGGEGRTRMKELHLVASDFTAFSFCVIIFSCVIILGRFGL